MKQNDNNFQEELATKHSELEAQRKEREGKLVDLNLGRIYDSVNSKAVEIETTLNVTKGKGLKNVMQTVEEEIIRAADDTLWCPDYSFRRDAEQDINCYTGTHWVNVESATWKYFVKQCSERCGLPKELRMDADFMKKLTNHMAFNLFKALKNNMPDDVVCLNTPEGTLIIKRDGSVTQREHRKEDLFYYCLTYNFDPKAECPLWRKTLNRVLSEKEAQQLLAEFFCYILMKGHRFEKILWLYGPGQNGKSTVLKVLEALLGSANLSFISLSVLTKSQNVRLGIEHKMVNISSESGRDVDPNTLKALSSGEKVTVERKYHDARQTDDYGKFVVATNKMPNPEDTQAFFRRLIIMPFEVTITEQEKDIHLIDKLKEELPGILNWVLAAFPGLMERNAFTESELCNKALRLYMEQADSVSLFVRQMCVETTSTTKGVDLYYSYERYCQFMHLDNKVGRNTFFANLAELGFKPAPNGNNAKLFNLKLAE